MLSTRLTRFFEIEHPVISAPMAFAAGGKLAASVTSAGGLGLIGGAYCDQQWIGSEFDAAGNVPVGCGFITWSLAQKGDEGVALLDEVLQRDPKAIFLSFGDPGLFANRINDQGTPLICQVQTMRDARRAIDCGASVIVAQGAEAGGHGETRGTMAFVPEAATFIANNAPEVLLCAAGGIADGRGLAAALMLGADGVLVGSRFWASEEAEVHPHMLDAALAASGDDTIRSSVMDIARRLDWPERYTARVLKNAFTERWHDDIDGLLAQAEQQAALWREAWVNGDTDTANTFVGEAAGLIDAVRPAEEIVLDMVREAKDRLSAYP